MSRKNKPPTSGKSAKPPGQPVPLRQALDIGFRHHAAGHFAEAEKLYDAVLRAAPLHPDALYLSGVLARQTGRLDRAVELLTKAVEAAADNADTHHQLGTAYQGLGRAKEAVACFETAIALDPRHAGAHGNLGFALQEQNRWTEAVACYRTAVSIDPKVAEFHLNLGGALRKLGKLDESVKSLREAVSLNPTLSEAHNSLGVSLRDLGDAERSVACFQKALALDPRNGAAHFNLGVAHKKLGRAAEAAACFEKALEITPDSQDARMAYSQLLSSDVPTWHYPMMNDKPRNDAYEGAIRAAVTRDTLVLEIGTGAGLLAMMAARAGAEQVVTAEMVPTIARAAAGIVRKNGYGDVITVHNAVSTALKVGRDLPRKADVLITETFDVGLLGENAVQSIQHAREHLLRENAVIIPRRAVVHGALFESEELHKTGKVGSVSGFDLSDFNVFTRTYGQKCMRHYPHALLTDPFQIFDFDFMGAEILPQTKPMSVTPVRTGLCHGLAFWFRLFLDDDYVFDSAVSENPENHWEQAIYYLDRPVRVRAGEAVSFTASHNNKFITFAFAGAANEN
ncbi:MAG: tetratricopeptide repeat protein [Alphaproteobacteria bacterium]|nr:tetratricopeptide repeat protein [Alphaproteobacteria bacterium]